MITPAKKPAHGELTNTDRRNNTTINRVRYLIERVIANLTTWRVLHTDYRRPYNTFETTIKAITGLIFSYILWIGLIPYSNGEPRTKSNRNGNRSKQQPRFSLLSAKPIAVQMDVQFRSWHQHNLLAHVSIA